MPLIVTDNERNRNIPLPLENNSVCFFNSFLQALFSLSSFREHDKTFTINRPSDGDAAVSNITTLF